MMKWLAAAAIRQREKKRAVWIRREAKRLKSRIKRTIKAQYQQLTP